MVKFHNIIEQKKNKSSLGQCLGPTREKWEIDRNKGNEELYCLIENKRDFLSKGFPFPHGSSLLPTFLFSE